MSKKRNKFQNLFDHKMWFYDFVKWTGALPVVLSLRVRRIYLSGKKPKKLFLGKYIVASNHVSYVDPVILSNVFATRRVSFVAAKELFSSKLKNWFFNAIGCIKVDRENVSVDTFKEVRSRVSRGHIVALFPEGHVENDGQTDTYKAGVVMMALIANAPVLPVYIVKRKNFWHRQTVVIGEKIDVKQYAPGISPTMEQINDVAKVLYEKELELKNRYDSYLNSKHKRKGDITK